MKSIAYQLIICLMLISFAGSSCSRKARLHHQKEHEQQKERRSEVQKNTDQK